MIRLLLMTVTYNFSYTVHELLPLGCTEKMLHQATKIQHNFRKMGRATYPTMSKSHIFSVVTKKDNLALHLRKNGQNARSVQGVTPGNMF